jgi:hypothetical protein
MTRKVCGGWRSTWARGWWTTRFARRSSFAGWPCPPARQNGKDVSDEIRRLVDRALQNFADDEKAFRSGGAAEEPVPDTEE